MSDQEWKTLTGWFWIYYNTRKGRKPTYRTEEYELWARSPWVIKRFKDRASAYSNDPDRSDWHDIFAQEIRNESFVGVQTVYLENPPWREHRSSIRYVRGYLVVEGTIKYR